MRSLHTVRDYIDALNQYPSDWPVHVVTPAGGEVVVEHREINGKPVVGVYGRNGGKIGESPLTEEEYQAAAKLFLALWNDPSYRYTTIHGDHRMYLPAGMNDTCYGYHFDRRIIERLVTEGIISNKDVEIDRVKHLENF